MKGKMITTQQRKNRGLLVMLMEHVKWLQKKTGKKLFNIRWYQDTYYNEVMVNKDKKSVINCDSTCCVSGWVALCPAFVEQGIKMGENGSARFQGAYGDFISSTDTFVDLFGIDSLTAGRLIYSSAWAKSKDKVTVDDVIKLVKGW
jgi:hypothetical protein